MLPTVEPSLGAGPVEPQCVHLADDRFRSAEITKNTWAPARLSHRGPCGFWGVYGWVMEVVESAIERSEAVRDDRELGGDTSSLVPAVVAIGGRPRAIEGPHRGPQP